MIYKKTLNYIALSLFLFFFLFPFIIYFHNNIELSNFFVKFKNLKVDQNKYLISFINSVIISLTVVTFSFVISFISAYAFVFKKFPCKDFLFIFILTPFMIPEHILIIQLFFFFIDLKIYDTLLPVILSHLGNNSIGIFFCYIILKNFPRDIFENAYAEGCNHFSIITKIIFPLKYRELSILFLILFYVNFNKTIFSYTFIESLHNYTFPIFVRFSGLNIDSLFVIFISLLPAYYIIYHLDKISINS